MSRCQQRFGRVAFRVRQHDVFFLLLLLRLGARVLFRLLLLAGTPFDCGGGGYGFREVTALRVVEDEGFARVVRVVHGVGKGGEQARGDGGCRRESAVVQFGGGEGGDEAVHSVLGREHAFDGRAVEGEEPGEEGGFEVAGDFWMDVPLVFLAVQSRSSSRRRRGGGGAGCDGFDGGG